MKAAVVDKGGRVVNVIVAGPDDKIPGMRVIAVTTNTGIQPGDRWTEERGLHMSAEREARVLQSDSEHQAAIISGRKLTDQVRNG